jgi:tetratricopeptide (TPR) repeat protein
VHRKSRGYAPALADLQEAESLFARSAALIPSGDAAALRAASDRVTDVKMEQADVLRRLAQDAASFSEAMAFMDRARALSEGARDYWEGRLRSEPSDSVAANRLGQATSESTKGEVSLAAARIEAAKELEKADPSTASAAFEQSRVQLESARSVAAQARATFESLVRDNPAHGRFARDLMLAIHNQGEAVMWTAFLESHVRGPGAPETLNLHASALGLFEEAQGMAQRLAEADEANVAAQRDLAMCLNKVGNQLTNLGRMSEAAPAFDRSLDVRRTLWLSDPTQIHRRDLAQALLKRAQLDQRLALRAGFDEKRSLLASARSLIEEGLAHLEALQSDGALSDTSEDLRRARETLQATIDMLGNTDDQP